MPRRDLHPQAQQLVSLHSTRIIFFTWQGFDEMDEVNGDASAELDEDSVIEIRFHLGDETIQKAER